MIDLEHANLVFNLAKDGEAIRKDMTPAGAHLLHMAVGVAGESGELLDAIKKSVIYNKPLDAENVIEELGDLEFYMQGIRAQLNLTREEVLQANITKLRKRYPAGSYSNQDAQLRADKSTDMVTD